MGSEVVLLVHGFAGDSGNWTYVQSMLGGKRRVVAMDLPGHGQSSKTMGRDPVAELIDAVKELARHLHADRLHLVGHSLGGAIALGAAPKLPTLASLTLIAPCGLGPGIDARFIDGLIRAERRRDLEPVVARLFSDPKLVSRQMINDLLKYKREEGVQSTLTALAAAAFPDGRQILEMRPTLLQLLVPLQIIWGADDQIIPSSHATGLPDTVQIHRLVAAGHMPHVERAGEVVKLIEAISG
jgi:pyruvate dehydrogenase E2 component (dihydrolipoamide acetyltransferase)